MAVKIPSKRRVRRPIPEFRVINPGKGLNVLISDSLIKDEEASDLNNIQFVESGAVSKRFGHAAVGTGLSARPKGLGVLYTTSLRQLLTVDGITFKYLNGTTWDLISGPLFTLNQEVNFCQASTAVYIWNGTDAGSRYDGTTLTRPTTTPTAAFGIYYQGYQIVAGVTSKRDRLYISTSTDPSDFTNASGTLSTVDEVPGTSTFAGTGAQFIDVGLGDGDRITGLSKFQNSLVIFKERSIYSMVFDATGIPVVTAVTNSIGCVSHKSIDNVENDVFFLTRNGYYVLGNEPNFFNVIRNNELSQRINPLIQTITSQNLGKAVSIYSGFTFYSCIPSGGTLTNNRLLTYDRRYLGWSKGDNVNVNAFTEFIDSNNVKHLYYAAEDESQVFEIGSNYTDNGTAINAYWVSKAFDGGNFEIYKHFIDVTLLFRQITGSVNISVIADGDETIATTSIASSVDLTGTAGSDMFGSYLWGGSTSSTATTTNLRTANIPYRLDINRDARTLKVKVSNSVNNENFTLLGFIITYRPYSHYQFPSTQRLYGGSTLSTTTIVTESGEELVTE